MLWSWSLLEFIVNWIVAAKFCDRNAVVYAMSGKLVGQKIGDMLWIWEGEKQLSQYGDQSVLNLAPLKVRFLV